MTLPSSLGTRGCSINGPGNPMGHFPGDSCQAAKRMALPALPEASWLPHLETGLRTFHLDVKVLPARSVNVGQEPGSVI